MPDLDDRFRSLARTTAPDLWDEVAARPPRPLPPEPRGQRVVAGVMALLVAVAGFAVAVSAFRGETRAKDNPPADADEISGPAAIANGQIGIARGHDQDIVLLDPETGAVTPLVDRHGADQTNALEMAWSPDGSMLAYAEYRDGGDSQGLFVLDVATGDIRDLTQEVFDADHPAWSPDGTEIAYSAYGEGIGSEIYVVGVDGSGLRRVTDRPDNGVDGAYMPAWSPDGSRIAFKWNQYDEATETERSGIAVVHLETNQETIVTNTPENDENPAWSPDGTRIALLRQVTGSVQLLVANADGSGERLILRDEVDPIPMSRPSWSPDGSELLFGANVDDWGIWLADADGTNPRPIWEEDAYAAGPVWAPDGSLIAFVGDDGGQPLPRVTIGLIRPDGSGQRALAAMESVSDIAWQPVLSVDEELSSTPVATIEETIELGQSGGLLYAAGNVWVDVLRDPATSSGTLIRLDAESGEELAKIPVDAFTGSDRGGRGMAFDGRYLWIVGTIFGDGGADRGVLVRVDPETNGATTIDLPVGLAGGDLVFDGRSLWTTGVTAPGRDPRVIEIDPTTGEVVSETPIHSNWWGALAVVDGAIWIAESHIREDGAWDPFELVRLELGTGDALASVPIEDANGTLGDLEPLAGEGSIWVGTGSELLRVDPQTGQVLDRNVLRVGPDLEFTDDGSAWFLGGDRWNRLQRLNPEIGEVDVEVELPREPIPVAIAVAPRAVWVLTHEGTLTKVALS